MRRVIAILVLPLALVSIAANSGSPQVFAEFDGAAGHLPEGVSVDQNGDVYVTLGPPFFLPVEGHGEVRRISQDGTEETLFEFPSGPAPAGIVVTRNRGVYFAVPDLTQASVGVYHLTAGGTERIAGTEAMLVPNGLAIDRWGATFASDSVLGQIWKAPQWGGNAEPWLTHELLAGCGGVGANGVAFWRGDLYVANTDRGALVRVPIDHMGNPGELEIVAGDADCEIADELWGMDGIAFDVGGNVYATLVLQHKLVRIDLGDGSSEVLLTEEDGLWNPASLAFGTGRGGSKTLYITNYAVLPPVPPANLGPAVLTFDVGVPGMPLP